MDQEIIINSINGLLTAVDNQRGEFERAIKRTETAILDRIGAKIMMCGEDIGRLKERTKTLEGDVKAIADKLRDVDGTAKDNNRKLLLAGSVIGAVLATGGTLSIGDFIGNRAASAGYEERASAIVDAAARCNRYADMEERDGKRLVKVQCVNRHLAGPHASRFEILVATEWADSQ